MISKLLKELNEKNEELNKLLQNEDFFKDLERRISIVNNENENLKHEVKFLNERIEIRDKEIERLQELIKGNKNDK